MSKLNFRQMFATKSIEQYTDEIKAHDTNRQFERVLGPMGLIMMGCGSMVGAGLFSITGIVVGNHAGPAAIISFLIAALTCLFTAMCYCEMATLLPVSGAAYAFSYASFGRFAGWLISAALVLEYIGGAAVVASSWSSYVLHYLSIFHIHLPFALTHTPFESQLLPNGTLVHGIVNLPAVVILTLLTMLLIRGVKESMTINTIGVIVKLAVIVLLIGCGAFYIKPENFVPFIPQNTGIVGQYGISGVIQGSALIFFAFLGFDIIAAAAQEVKNPERNLNIGILGALGLCTVFYVLFAIVAVGVRNYRLYVGDASPVGSLVSELPFPWLIHFVNLAVIMGFMTVMLMLMFAQSRIFLCMAQDKQLPRFFLIFSKKYQTPIVTHLIVLVSASILAGFLPITLLGSASSEGILLAFMVVCLGVIRLRYTRPDVKRFYRVPFGNVIPILGALSCGYLAYSLKESTPFLIGWMLVATVLYFIWSFFVCRDPKKS